MRSRSLIGCFATGAFVLSGCGDSPWEQGPSQSATAMTADRTVERSFLAASASLGTWLDERKSVDTSVVFSHGMLVVEAPRLRARHERTGSSILITSLGPELQRKVEDILADRIPVSAGLTTNFALGRAIPVRIEKLDVDGSRTLREEGTVAFLELTR